MSKCSMIPVDVHSLKDENNIHCNEYSIDWKVRSPSPASAACAGCAWPSATGSCTETPPPPTAGTRSGGSAGTPSATCSPPPPPGPGCLRSSRTTAT